MRTLLLLFLGGFMLAGCEKEFLGERPIVRVETLPVVEINETGVTFQGRLVEATLASEIEAFGFYWDNKNTYEKDQFIGLRPPLFIAGKGTISPEGVFNARVDYGLFAGQAGIVRAFVRYKGKEIYGEVVQFTNNGSQRTQQIVSFSPTNLVPGREVVVRLSDTSLHKTIVEAFIGQLKASILRDTGGQVTLLVPAGIADRGEIKLKDVFGRTPTSPGQFTRQGPQITTELFQGGFGDTLVLVGQYISPLREVNRVEINGIASGYVCPILEVRSDSIVFVIPRDAPYGGTSVALFVDNKLAKAPLVFRGPVVNQVVPDEFGVGTIVSAEGTGFSTNLSATFVSLWSLVTESSTTIIPTEVDPAGERYSFTINSISGEISAMYNLEIVSFGTITPKFRTSLFYRDANLRGWVNLITGNYGPLQSIVSSGDKLVFPRSFGIWEVVDPTARGQIPLAGGTGLPNPYRIFSGPAGEVLALRDMGAGNAELGKLDLTTLRFNVLGRLQFSLRDAWLRAEVVYLPAQKKIMIVSLDPLRPLWEYDEQTQQLKAVAINIGRFLPANQIVGVNLDNQLYALFKTANSASLLRYDDRLQEYVVVPTPAQVFSRSLAVRKNSIVGWDHNAKELWALDPQSGQFFRKNFASTALADFSAEPLLVGWKDELFLASTGSLFHLEWPFE